MSIAKNYLNEDEMKKLESLILLFLDYAEDMANEEYEEYRIKQDQEYISSMDEMYKRYLDENKVKN